MSFDGIASVPTQTPGTPKGGTPPHSPQMAPQGPSQLLTVLLVRLPDCTNRALIDQAAVDFAFLNSKAARKRLIRVRKISLLIFLSLNRKCSLCLKFRRTGQISFHITQGSSQRLASTCRMLARRLLHS